MKIAQFIDSDDIGGAESMLISLSRALITQGHEVVIFHLGNQYISADCQKYGLSEVIIPQKHLYRSIMTVFLFSILFARLLRSHKIDILHSHLYGSITGAFLGTFLYRLPHIGTLHDLYMVQERIGRGVMLRIAQFTGTRLVSVSNDMQLFYEDYIPAAKKLTTIYNGFDLNSSKTGQDTPFTDVPKSNFVRIVTVGRLIELKQQYQQLCNLIDIIKNDDIQLIFVGDGPEFEHIQEKISSEGLGDKVFLLGERNDVLSILKSSDIFILASQSEGLSCSIIEAMAVGLPAIVSNVGGNRELIKNGVNGYLFELNDHDQFKLLVSKLINNSEERQKMGTVSKDIANTTFSTTMMAKNYINLYKQV